MYMLETGLPAPDDICHPVIEEYNKGKMNGTADSADSGMGISIRRGAVGHGNNRHAEEEPDDLPDSGEGEGEGEGEDGAVPEEPEDDNEDEGDRDDEEGLDNQDKGDDDL